MGDVFHCKRGEYRVLSSQYSVLRTQYSVSCQTGRHTMSGARNFTDLLIWQQARAWSKTIFWLTKDAPFCTAQRLTVQINDSSESVFANIAEGFGRGTQGEFVTFIGYALGSLNETQSHLCAAYDREYLSKAKFG